MRNHTHTCTVTLWFETRKNRVDFRDFTRENLENFQYRRFNDVTRNEFTIWNDKNFDTIKLIHRSKLYIKFETIESRYVRNFCIAKSFDLM